jgi:hypothetical protein
MDLLLQILSNDSSIIYDRATLIFIEISHTSTILLVSNEFALHAALKQAFFRRAKAENKISPGLEKTPGLQTNKVVLTIYPNISQMSGAMLRWLESTMLLDELYLSVRYEMV